jgi:type IV pilus assembly protein PilX
MKSLSQDHSVFFALKQSSQRGAALFVALILLLVLTLLGLSASNTSILQERMIANSIETQLAFQRAEAGLRQIEAVTQRSSFGGIRSLVEPFTISAGGTFQFNDCTLTARTDGDWDELPWQSSTTLDDSLDYVVDWNSLPTGQGFLFDFVILELIEYEEAGGLPRVSCRFGGETTNEFGVPVQPDFYIVLSRVSGRAEGGRQSESIVQSIFWWP